MVDRQQTMSKVREAMTSNVVSIQSNDDLIKAAQAMREHGIGELVVMENGELFGVVTDRDIVVRGIAQGKNPGEIQVRDIASREVKVTSPEANIDEAVETMQEQAIRRLPVVEGKSVVGVISLGDLALHKQPESALGDISGAPPNT